MRFLVVIIAALAVWPCLAQEDGIDRLAERLIQLRAEVEQLQSDLDIEREEHKGKMSYLAAQKAELEVSLGREELRLRQLEEELAQLREKAAAAGTDAETLSPTVYAAIDQIRQAITSSLPFKHQERLEALNEIVRQLDSGAIVPQRGANRLWALVEDELRINRENAIYSQTIQLNGQPILADVAKLGSVAMYFRTRDDRYGLAQASGGEWIWTLVEDTDGRDQIATLFDSLRKQIRQGYFEIPGALPALSEVQS